MKITRGNYEAYREGFLSGMRIDKNCPQILMVAGYKFEQILELVLKDQEEKAMGMTRKEAISKCHGIAYPETLVQALEALGVLKFNEPKREIEVLYSAQALSGEIILETWSDKGLTLKINNQIVYQYKST